MKLNALVLFFCCLLAGFKVSAQTISLTVKNAKLETVLKQFKKQTGYSFFYNESIFNNAGKITLDLRNVELDQALGACFVQTPMLGYSIVGQTVVIAEKNVPDKGEVTAAGVYNQMLKGITVSGYVYNKRYESLSNASVMVRGTQKGTSTNADGSFKLENVKEDDMLKISFIGYKTTEVQVKIQSAITVILEEAKSELDQVVTQGYGKTTQRMSTSSVNKVSGAEIARQPVMNPLLALQGKIPGLVVTPSTGYAAGPVQLEIRGRGLLSEASGSPLIVIDGTPLNVSSSQQANLGDGPMQGMFVAMSPAASQSPLFGLNPSDIESIDLLKDIAATAIYGSAGSNGVLLITTKKGKPGNASVDVNVNYGVSKISRYWKMLNTQQYLQMRREALKNDGIIPNAENAPDLLMWDTTRYTDWQKELWGNAGRTLNATVSLSGGTPQFTHRLSFNYSRMADITRISGGNESMGVSLSLDRKSNNQKFMTAFSANYFYTSSDMVRFPAAGLLPPNAPPIFDEQGNLNWKSWTDANLGSIFEPFSSIASPVVSKTNSLNANLRLAYLLTKQWTISVSMGFAENRGDGMVLFPIKAQNPLYNPTGTMIQSASKSNTWTIEPQTTYETDLFGKGKLKLLAGATLKHEKRQSFDVMGMGYTSDALLRSLAQAAFSLNSNTSTPYKYSAAFGSMEYSWDYKYVLDVKARRDGSSRFGAGNRFGNFGSVGAAWIASDEPWMKKMTAPFISFLKFNANTGIAGNDGGGDYQYLSQWNRITGMLNYDGVVPVVNQHAVNQDYHWQTTKEISAGMEARFLSNGRFGFGINYYRRRMMDQLVNNPTPVYTGFGTVYGNWDAVVQNSGWEFRMNAALMNAKDFNWTVYVNGAFNRNILLSFPDIDHSAYYTRNLVGHSITENYLLNYLGVDPQNGNYQFQDYNKDGKITRNSNDAPLSGISDMRRIMNTAPRFSGGMTHSISYKNFLLSLAFDFIVKDGQNAFVTIPVPGHIGNIPVEIFNNHWQKPGDQARYAKFTNSDERSYASNISTLGVTDASFFRFNNISFEYTLPERLLSKLKIKGGSFNINTRNLFVITSYEGIDPESNVFGNMPPAKTITAGFKLNL